MTDRSQTYGLLVEVESATALVDVARTARDAGYTRINAYSPFPIEGLTDALGKPKTKLPLLVFAGGLFGCIGGYLLQYWYSVYAYPINVGGRPQNSWPQFIPVTFECTILVAALTAVLGMLALNGLPQPYHPLFHIKEFERATHDSFFFCVQVLDPKFDFDETADYLRQLTGNEPIVVPR